MIICLVILAFGHFFGLTSGYQIQENDNEFLLQIPKLLEKETAKTTQMNNGILNQNDVTNILYNMLIKIKAYNERNQRWVLREINFDGSRSKSNVSFEFRFCLNFHLQVVKWFHESSDWQKKNLYIAVVKLLSLEKNRENSIIGISY